jgi:hypothetical protein
MKNLFRPGIAVLLLLSSYLTKAQVPVLSSYPSASAVVFLDFDGHTVSGTSWNFSGPIECGASGLTNTQITEVFNRVAEDYRPFNINITTDSTKFLAAAANRRMRVIVTVSSSWYGNAGGVAFVNSFTWGDNTPCFVFSELLAFNTKNVSEAAAHEAGHTLGLYHQAKYDANCVKLNDYHGGVGPGFAESEIGWAPIMGVGYYRNLTLWNNGPNPYGCTNIQNDLDVITTNNGFSYRTDDHNSTFNQSTQVDFNNNQFTVNGVVERNTDQDLIKFTIPATGRFQLSAVPYNVGTGNAGSDLDLQVTLINSSQTTLNVYNPGTLLSSLVDTVLNPGNYYLRIEGKGNQYAPAYASLGSYALAGNFTAGGALPLHKLELTGSLSGDKHRLDWEIIADEQIIDLRIEIATDGRNFTELTQTDNSARLYIYRPSTQSTAQYRLHVTFDDGREYYSNVVTIRNNNGDPRPQLIGNLISNNTIKISSPGKYNYLVSDMSGKIVAKGQLVSGLNTLNAAGMINGLYIIRFNNDSQQWTDKLIRQ